ncbi:MAG TPA: ABC transporter ATP-binding protein [Actinomycetota bacterium]|nr:ABC transporter ATP-binding protein [Actinomycetota bacterium]
MASAVEVNQVSKQFKRYKERPHTLKERVIRFRRDRGYDEFWALENVSFEIPQGTTFGLIGANGSGKSTLLKIIAGILNPTSGAVAVNGRLGALLELGAGFHPDLTGRENVYLNASILGFTRKEIQRKFDDIVEFAELEDFIDNQVRHYSSGMFVRLGFAVAVHMDPEVLLIDEVLAVGDESFQDKCLQRIRKFQEEGRTIVVVTHAVETVKQMCNAAALLDHGALAVLGSPSQVVAGYRERMAAAERSVDAHLEVLDHARVVDVKLLNREGKPVEVFRSGSPMFVEADLDVKVALDDPIFDLNIMDNSSAHIFGTNTGWRGQRIPLQPGPAKLKVELGDIPMKAGRFFLVVGVHASDGSGAIFGRSKRIHFQIENATDEPGRVFIHAKFSAEGPAVAKVKAR